MNYLYTNEQLGSLLIMPSGAPIDWAYFGSSITAMSKAVSKGFQQPDGDDMISFMPIVNEEAFYAALGDKLRDEPDEEGLFARVVTEEFAVAERDRLKAINEAKAAEAAKRAPMSDSEKLDLLIEAQADMIGGIA